ncbi:MAG: Maf family nucleotide pyrophosphatase [Pseudoxanthomonas sp.]
MPLILASTSRYRRELLERLSLPFNIARPDIDETPLPGETAPLLARRLALAKAAAITLQHPEARIIGSDQVAALGEQSLGKPGTRENAIAQLVAMSGREVLFHTAVCLLRGSEPALEVTDVTRVRFRELTVAEIERYVDAEQPLDCAGSFKCEGLGISLFDAIETVDPTALVGLPLIALSKMLRQAGYQLP